jgi:ribosomal protein S18 acetylase RimI-like enzyme
MNFRTAVPEDLQAIIKLYKDVASRTASLARTAEETDEEYVRDFLNKSIDHGIIIVAEHPTDNTQLIGEIHAYKKGISVFDHVLSELTIVVHPDHQSKKIGRTIFTIFLEEVALHRPDIGRVELIARESNTKAIRLYQSLGFLIEGRLEMRIKNKK